MRQIFLPAHILLFQHVLAQGQLFGMSKSVEMKEGVVKILKPQLNAFW